LSVVRGGVGLRLQRRWSLPLLAGAGGAAAVVLLGGLGFALLGPLTARLVMLLLSALFILFLVLSLPLLALVMLFADKILQNPGVTAVLQDVAGRLVAVFRFLIAFFLDLSGLLEKILARLPDWRWARNLLLAAAVGAALWFFLAQIRLRVEGGRTPIVADEDLGDIPGRNVPFSSLGDTLAHRLAVLRGRLIGKRDGLSPALRIRRIYRDMLEVGEALGAPRARWQTPLEYGPVLRAVLGGCGEEVGRITDAYLAVRYGLLPEADLSRVEAAWQAVQARAADRLAAERLFAQRQAGEEGAGGSRERGS